MTNPVLHHINLKTPRLQEMIDWYGTVVGTTASFQFPIGAWLSNDGANHRIALISTPAIKDDPDQLTHAGMHHVAFEYASMEALLENYTRLKELGMLPHMSLDHGMTTSFYYIDPDGNSVELQCDNFASWAQSKEWMRTSPDFAKNPIGVQVDPDRMVEARAAGASPTELHRRAYAGEFDPGTPLNPRLPM
jgi:catechol 2,3-dioxygenase